MPLSGQTTVPTPGQPVPLGDQPINGPLLVKALAGNTSPVYLGRDAANGLTPASGLPLAAGEVVVFAWVGHLAILLLDAAVDGEGVAWLCLSA